MNKLKVLELFGGIGACSKALERLGIDYEIADYVEIDKYAVKSFNTIHNTNFEPQDITQWDKDIKVDLIMHGSPCQDFSLAGLQAGGDEGSGTRSSLMYETIRIVKKLKPKYVIWENVKNLLSKKHRHNFDSYLEIMEKLGYTNYYQVLNAKDYGIPQNRERVFTVSIRADVVFREEINFDFPPKQELKLKLKDMLEDNVDEKYYLSDKMIKYISATGTANFKNPDSRINLYIARPLTTDQNKRAGTTNYLSNDLPDNYDLNEVNKIGHIPQWHQRGGIYDENGLAPTICATDYKTAKLTTIKIKNATKKGYQEAFEGDSVNLAYPDSKTRRGRVGKQVSQTLQCNDSMGVIEKNKYSEESLKRIKQNIIKNDIANTLTANAMQSFNHNNCALINNNLRIRKLTPKECWRLMGFDDEDFEKVSKVNSNTQLYKQAGNSIVVNVLMAIFNELLKKEGE